MEANNQVPRPSQPYEPWYKRVAEAAKDLRNAGRDFGALLWGIIVFLMAISIINSPEDFGRWLKAFLPKLPVTIGKSETPAPPRSEPSAPQGPSTRRYLPKPQTVPKVALAPPSNHTLQFRDSVTVTLNDVSRQAETTIANPNVINIIINGHKLVFQWDKRHKDTLTYVYVPDLPAVEEPETRDSPDLNMIVSKTHYKKIYLKIQAVHVIGQGDIYRVVAQKYGVSKDVLMKLNNKTSIRAERGDQLIIPFSNEEYFHFVFG